MKTQIKIPSQHYIGVVPRNNKISEAVMTPFGTDNGSKNRKESVDAWISHWVRGLGIHSKGLIIANEPYVGFRITACHQHTGADTWKVEDPRGFETEISGTNLLELMKTVTIKNGEILEPCIWARNKSSNVLISVLSNDYKIAVSNTAAANSKASWRDVKPGNKIVLQNNVRGTYLGKMWAISFGIYSRQECELTDNDIKSANKTCHVILEESGTGKSYSETLHLIAAPKLSSISDSSELTLKECEIIANEKLNDKSCSVRRSSYHNIIALTVKRPNLETDVQIISTPVIYSTDTELSSELMNSRARGARAIFIKTSDVFGKLGYYNSFSIVEYSYEHFQKNELRRKLHLSPSRKSYYNLWSEKTQKWDFNNKDQFMNLDVEVTTGLGNLLNYSVK